MTMEIKIEPTSTPRVKPDPNNLGFGNYFTDHMFIMEYAEGKGWHDPRIIPYQPLVLDPATMVLHYGQAIFEGLKAYKCQDGSIKLFRPYKNVERINVTNDRMCIPPVDLDFVVDSIRAVVKYDQSWIPEVEGTSMYIRPFIIATDPFLGVRPSHTYKFMIILSPVGAYYPEGINPIKIYVESNYVRAVKGGVGFAKTAGNYAASLKAQVEAQEKGYTQVLWLDGVEKKYIEEVGTMNVFFKIGGEVITPSLEGSILSGITRDSVISILKNWGVPLIERKLGIEELYQAHAQGVLEEVFGTGTAAVISPVGELNWNDNIIQINNGETGPLSARLYQTITGIQNGSEPDIFGWMMDI